MLAKRDKDSKAKEDAAWFKETIRGMKNTHHLVSWLANLTPMGKDVKMTDTGRATICGNVKNEIEAYDWNNFSESTTIFTYLER